MIWVKISLQVLTNVSWAWRKVPIIILMWRQEKDISRLFSITEFEVSLWLHNALPEKPRKNTQEYNLVNRTSGILNMLELFVYFA